MIKTPILDAPPIPAKKLKGIEITSAHGQMDKTDLENIMMAFINKESDVLICTTIIETGIDIPNVNTLIIYNADRFGLSQLYQIRGRVGRSSLQSYCILVSNKETKRLEILTKTNDGFKISEEDFKLRGSGDLFGERQSGDMAFKMANIKNDFNILVRAKEDSEEFLKELNKTKEKNIWQDYLLNTMNLD